MEIGTIKRIVFAVVAVIMALLLSYIIGHRDGLNSAVRGENNPVDTTYVHDTIIQYRPILEERVVLEKIFVPVTDTLWQHDTLYVYMEREQVVWQDTLARVYASGIMPQIDSVQHFVREVIVTMEKTRYVKKPCRWGLGVQAGYGIQLGEQLRTAPYVGVGVSYNILSW